MTNMWQQLVTDYPWLAWICQNCEWIFSGIGVLALGVFFKKSAGVIQHTEIIGNDAVVTISHGLSYTDVKEISRDIIKTELEHYSDVALKKVIERVELIGGLFIKKFATTNDGREKKLQEPNAQYSFRNAILGYIRTGDNHLGNILVELISERLIYEERGLLQIATDNAIIDLIDITNEQLNFLTFIYFINIYHIQCNTFEKFKNTIEVVSKKIFHVDMITRYDVNNILSTRLLKDQSTTFRSENALISVICYKYKLFFEQCNIKIDKEYSISQVRQLFDDLEYFNRCCKKFDELREQPVTLLPAGIILGNVNLALQFPELPRQEIKF